MKAILKSVVITSHNEHQSQCSLKCFLPFLSFMSLDLATQITVTNIPKG